MSLFSAIGGALASCVSAAVGVCSSIGGSLLGSIGTLIPVLKVVGELAIKAISALATIFTDKPEKESPEEIAMKAEKSDKKPEDFDTVSEYLEHLRKEVQLDEGAVENLSDFDRLKYTFVGSGLYVKDMEERLGVKMEEGFIKLISWLYENKYKVEDISVLVCALKDNGITDLAKCKEFLLDKLDTGSQESVAISNAVEKMVEKHFEGQSIKTYDKIDELKEDIQKSNN